MNLFPLGSGLMHKDTDKLEVEVGHEKCVDGFELYAYIAKSPCCTERHRLMLAWVAERQGLEGVHEAIENERFQGYVMMVVKRWYDTNVAHDEHVEPFPLRLRTGITLASGMPHFAIFGRN